MEALQPYIDLVVNTPPVWDSEPMVTWMQQHVEVPVFAVGIYLWFIFSYGPTIKEPVSCRPLFALWNLFLAVFSITGAYYTVPHLLNLVMNTEKFGFFASVCHNPKETFYNTDTGFWVALFIWSKIPELIDTVFLVIQKKPVIFLHWYHHVTVCLYCWHAYTNHVASGLWFATMNFCVHAIMYSYYFFMAVNLKMLVKPLAPLITTLQILQMVVGVVVTTIVIFVADDNAAEKPCATVGANARMGWVMYASYFVLFVQLFVRSYMKPKNKKKTA